MADTMHDGLVDLLPHDHSKLKNLTPTGPFDMKVESDSYFVKCFVIGRETSVLSAELNWDDEDDWFGLFVQVFMSLPVVFHGGYLFRLHIETDLGDISETDWCTVLAAFPSITTLMTPRANPSGLAGQYPLPKSTGVTYHPLFGQKALAVSLRSCLHNRAKKGVPILSKVCMTEPIPEIDPHFQWLDLSEFVTEFICLDLLELTNRSNMPDELE